jgi:hypothetical protein
MGIAFSEFGDPIPNTISELRCPSCGNDVLHDAYEVWQDEDLKTPTALRKFHCTKCGEGLDGNNIQSSEPYTFATSYLYVSEIDPEHWPEKVKSDIERVIGPCQEFLERRP